MSTDEMIGVIELAVSDPFDPNGFKKLIETNCGPLVYIDSQSRIRTIHATVDTKLLPVGVCCR